MFWNNMHGWQRGLWDELVNLESSFQGGSRYRKSYPGVKLYAGENEVLVKAEVPGVQSDDLRLEVQDNELTIGFNREVSDGDALRRERPRGEYEKSVRLPFRTKSDNISAELKSGVLTVRMERAEEDRPRKIAVTAS